MEELCGLCESDISDEEVAELSLEDRFVENPNAPPEQQRTDYSKLRRVLNEEYDTPVLVSDIEEHLTKHTFLSLS